MKFTLARKHTTLRLDNNADFSRLYWAQFLIAWWYQSEEELKGLLMKEENEKVGLKLNIQNKIMASGPITSWQNRWLTLFFWAPKSLQMVIAAMKLKDAYSLEGKL